MILTLLDCTNKVKEKTELEKEGELQQIYCRGAG
jgi:hypothetical protein